MIRAWIITIIGIGVWRWLLQHTLQFYRLRVTTMLVLIGLSMVGVLSIISFPTIYQQRFDLTRNNPLTQLSAGSYVVYMLVVSIVIGMIVLYRGGRQRISQQILFIISIALVTIGIPWVGQLGISYVLLAASIEEYVKYYLGAGAFRVYGITGSDLILFALMSGLGFACIENIVYLYHASSSSAVFSTTLRRTIGPIVHMMCSGLLAYGYWYLCQKGWGLGGLVVSAIATIMIHAGYNSISSQGSRWLIVIVVLGGYACISRLLYQCDRLYYEAKNNLKISV